MRSAFANLPGSLPRVNIADDIDLADIVKQMTTYFPSLTEDNFAHDAIWRDSLALTGTIRTFYGAENVAYAWDETSAMRSPVDFKFAPTSAHISRHGPYAWIHVGFNFETAGRVPHTSCSGSISIVPDAEGDWKIWVLTTIAENLVGFGDIRVLSPKATESPLDVETKEFEVVVVGGGQCGLAVGSRLQALGISYVVLDKFDEVGDCWKTRYDSMRLHTFRNCSQLPYGQTFDDTYPQWLGKDDVARGFQVWVKKFGINVWTATKLVSCSWRDRLWEVQLVKGGEPCSIAAKHIIFAVGTTQIPSMPVYPKKETFKGIILHSVDYKSSSQWRGKNGIVIGSGNTGHDVAVDMVEAGLESVTMIQRSDTWVLPRESYMKAQGPFYNSDLPVEVADSIQFSGPLNVGRQIAMYHINELAKKNPSYFDALEAAGFKTQRFGDLFHTLFERFGGHFFDVGAGSKITEGRIKVHSKSLPKEYAPDGLLFSDGTLLKADVVVFATGFRGNMRDAVCEFVEPDVQSKLSNSWGIDEEGELIGAYKFSGYPKLWYAGGDFPAARHYSKALALQVKADLVGVPFERYTKVSPVCHGLRN